MSDRSYDIVAFGATGFTGGLAAEYLAKNAPKGTRWAVGYGLKCLGASLKHLQSHRDELIALAGSALAADAPLAAE